MRKVKVYILFVLWLLSLFAVSSISKHYYVGNSSDFVKAETSGVSGESTSSKNPESSDLLVYSKDNRSTPELMNRSPDDLADTLLRISARETKLSGLDWFERAKYIRGCSDEELTQFVKSYANAEKKGSSAQDLKNFCIEVFDVLGERNPEETLDLIRSLLSKNKKSYKFAIQSVRLVLGHVSEKDPIRALELAKEFEDISGASTYEYIFSNFGKGGDDLLYLSGLIAKLSPPEREKAVEGVLDNLESDDEIRNFVDVLTQQGLKDSINLSLLESWSSAYPAGYAYLSGMSSELIKDKRKLLWIKSAWINKNPDQAYTYFSQKKSVENPYSEIVNTWGFGFQEEENKELTSWLQNRLSDPMLEGALAEYLMKLPNESLLIENFKFIKNKKIREDLAKRVLYKNIDEDLKSFIGVELYE